MKLHNPFGVAFLATLGVGLGLMLINGIQTLSTILLYIGSALFISLGLEPLVAWLEKRRLPRWAAVAITILAVLALFAGIMLMIVPLIVSQISQLVDQISSFLDSYTFSQFMDEVPVWIHSTFPMIPLQNITDGIASLQDWLLANWGSITGGVINVGIGLLGGLTGTLIVLILTIYFTASTPNLKVAVYKLVPASKRPRVEEIGEQITNSVGYYVMGQVALGVINGVLSAILLSIIQAPFPAVLAVVAFMFSLIPMVGTLTGSAIIVLTCLIPGLGSPTTALVAAIYYLIYMQVEAYIISPRIMNRAVSVPGAIVVIAALAGGSLLGILGALVAIPFAASALIIYRQVIIPRQDAR